MLGNNGFDVIFMDVGVMEERIFQSDRDHRGAIGHAMAADFFDGVVELSRTLLRHESVEHAITAGRTAG